MHTETGMADQVAGEEARKLAEYYLAALDYIDPELKLDSTLDEIASAVERHKVQLKTQPFSEVREEFRQLTEALLFVQRTHPKLGLQLPGSPNGSATDPLVATVPTGTSAALQEPEEQPEADTEDTPQEATRGDLVTEAVAQRTEDPPRSDQLDQQGLEADRAADSVVHAEQEELPEVQPEADAEIELAGMPELQAVPLINQPEASAGLAVPVQEPGLKIEPPKRLRKLSEILEEARTAAADDEGELELPASQYQPGLAPRAVKPVAIPSPTRQKYILPEIEVWPALRGILLIAWQLWLAAFSGWTCIRIAYWPYDGYGELGWWQLGLLGLSAVVVSIGIGWGVAVYRIRTWRILLPAILSGVVVLLHLLAWWLAGVRAEIASMHPPGWAWAAAVAAWLALLAVAFIYDTRVSERS